MQIKSRPPTGQVPYPMILVEGPEKAGKSLIPVVLSRSERVGMMYWFDLGEGSADEYAALPGSKYQVIQHDGSYRDILEQLTAVYEEATRAFNAGEPPVIVTVDSMSALWTMLVNWTNERARRSKNGVSKLAADPDAEIDPTSNLWNDANKRHARIMHLLMTFPGIAIVTARGKEVAKMGSNGQPLEGQKEWKVEGQKALAFDSSAWIRLQREPRTATLQGVRSLRVQVAKGQTMPMPMVEVGSWEVCDLEAFIFDVMGCTGGETQARDVVQLRGDRVEEYLTMIEETIDEETLRQVWEDAQKVLSSDETHPVSAAIKARLEALRAGIPEGGALSDAEKLAEAAKVNATPAGSPTGSGEPPAGQGASPTAASEPPAEPADSANRQPVNA